MIMHEHNDLPEGDVRSDQEIREPKFYRVILCNDDYTTMDFVIEILIVVFHKPAAEATRIMLDVHKKGKGLCGIYTYDIATTKIDRVHQMARKREFPLKCSLEET
jgi:ATP-dependent Clp protease adaptor protein ClpS